METAFPFSSLERKKDLTLPVQIPEPLRIFPVLEMFPGIFMYPPKPSQAFL